MKVLLGRFACNGIESYLDADVATGVRAALNDFTERLECGRTPLGAFRGPLEAVSSEPATAVDLSLDERTWQLLQREARRQETTVDQLAAHTVLLYLAELDRLTPPDAAATA